MKQDFDCVGFSAPENMTSFMRNALNEIQQESPDNSYIDAEIKKQADLYLLVLQVRHTAGTLVFRAANSDLSRVVSEGLRGMLGEIAHWREGRFASAAVMPTQSAAPTEPAPLKLNVLIVDDDVESVVPLEMFLRKFNCAVKIVSTGYAAVHEMISQDRSYDVMIIDWMMPDLNGRQTLASADQVVSCDPAMHQHWKRAQLPVITFSGSSRQEIDLPACKKFNFIEHWDKPAARWQLIEQVTETLAKLRSGLTV